MSAGSYQDLSKFEKQVSTDWPSARGNDCNKEILMQSSSEFGRVAPTFPSEELRRRPIVKWAIFSTP